MLTAMTSRMIVMTGANSGIGLEACKRLATERGTTIILACRTLSKSQEAIETITSTVAGVEAKLLPAECDLSNLASIKNFADKFLETNPQPIDVLCLNAGIAVNRNATDCARTVDGFELTIGTNHLGHFYLTHLLLQSIIKNSKSCKIVVTASSLHDPDSPGGRRGEKATMGNFEGIENQGKDFEMTDGQKFNGDKAYKDSKLCNVLFTRELQSRLDVFAPTNNICANCFSPGFIVTTGLFRDNNIIFVTIFRFLMTYVFKVGETLEWGGAVLSYMINCVNTKGLYYHKIPESGSNYDVSELSNPEVFGPVDVSIEAQDNNKAKRLWELSEKLLNIKTII